MQRLLISTVAAAAITHWAPSPLSASPADLIGLDARDVGQAVPIATATTPSGATLNAPAMLVRLADQLSISIIASGGGNLVKRHARPAGYDIDDSIYSARASDPNVRLTALATADLPTGSRTTNLDEELMLVITNVRRVADWASVGVVLAVPIASQIAPSTFYADEREAYFSNSVHLALLQDDRNTSVIAFGAGFAVTPALSLGLGAQLLVGAAPTASVYVPNALEPAVNDSNTTLALAPSVVPVASAQYDLTPSLAVLGSLRLRSAQKVRGATQIRLWAPSDNPIALSSQDLRYDLDSQPLRGALGLRYAQGNLTFAAEGVMRRGADFRDQHGEAPLIPFRNSWELGAHATAQALGSTIDAGVRYVRSPVPAQVGRENHADADRVIIGTAVTRVMARGKVVASLGLAAHRVRHRRETKDLAALVDEYPDSIDISNDPIAASAGLQTNNPGFPGYTVGGWIGALALTITVTP
ncbi:MAG: hypothetical protein IPL79_06030 [Myxococcales bacterium]|nr:hypothetical protein [Myxococcales bacterium]